MFSCNIFAQVTIEQEGKNVHIVHAISENDNLHKIATYYGVEVFKLKEYNQLVSNELDTLKIIKVPVKVQITTRKKNDGNYVLHKVQEQEQLHAIADLYQTSLTDLKRINQKKKNIVRPGEYLLIPNNFPINTESNNTVISGLLSVGFYSGTDWEGENSTSYNLRGRLSLQNVYKKDKFKILSQGNFNMGFRHEIGSIFYKNIDQFHIRNQFQYHINPNIAIFGLSALKSQFADTNYPLADGSKRLVSSFMAPGFTSLATGFVLNGENFLINFGLFEFKNIFVLQDKIYGVRTYAYGVPRGVKKYTLKGCSIRADINYYESERFNFAASLFSFFNSDIFTMELRGNLTYKLKKWVKLTILGELQYDKFYEKTLQYRTEVLVGVSLYKNKAKR